MLTHFIAFMANRTLPLRYAYLHCDEHGVQVHTVLASGARECRGLLKESLNRISLAYQYLLGDPILLKPKGFPVLTSPI